MEFNEKAGRLEIALPPALDLPVANELRELLLEALARDSGDVVLLADEVERVSTASVQVLAAALPAFRGASRALGAARASEAFSGAFRHLGLDAELADLLQTGQQG